VLKNVNPKLKIIKKVNMSKAKLLTIIAFIFALNTKAQSSDSTFIKVLFLYGSKPKKEFKTTEPTWFGGKWGGHVGIEFAPNEVIDFIPQGSFHVVSKKDRHSKFVIHTLDGFWSIFGGNTEGVRNPDSFGKGVKKATFMIPISKAQKAKMDTIVNIYTSDTPYDYAFMGMRCAAATYDVLAQLGIVESFSNTKIIQKNFYPKKLRKRLFTMALEKKWVVEKQEGSNRRDWEED
jgi:hypothetical protein